MWLNEGSEISSHNWHCWYSRGYPTGGSYTIFQPSGRDGGPFSTSLSMSGDVKFEIKVDTNDGKLWFGEMDKELKLVASDLLEIAEKDGSKNEGFTFCCSLYVVGQWVKIVTHREHVHEKRN